MFTVKTTV